MIEVALSTCALWLGCRMVALVAGNLITVNLARYNHVRGVKRREVVPTGCGCAVWMDTGETKCDVKASTSPPV